MTSFIYIVSVVYESFKSEEEIVAESVEITKHGHLEFTRDGKTCAGFAKGQWASFKKKELT